MLASWPPFNLIGITHRKADLALRERFARSPEAAAKLLGDTGRSGVVLSTCNRFEIYWWGSDGWSDWFLQAAGESGPVPRTALVRHRSLAAVRHLFGVAAGLDSQVLGEHEILGQVRRAWGLAREQSATTRELDLVFASAIAAGRRVRRETVLGHQPGSIGSVAVEAVQARIGSLHHRPVVVIGAGEAARGVVSALAEAGADIRLVVRHRERATALAERYQTKLEPWEMLDGAMAEAPVIFAATSAPHAFLAAERLVVLAPGTVVVDLGVPRNVAPEARSIAGLTVLDLDDLQAGSRGRLPEIGPGIESARIILERESSRLLGKLERWSAPVSEPESSPARADSAG